MQFPLRFLVLTVCLLATVLGVGAAHGLWTERWPSEQRQQKILEMRKIPLTAGAWEGITVQNSAASNGLEDTDSLLFRRYVNPLDGTVAEVMLTCGRPGPLVIKHLPTECFPSSGYEIVGQRKRFVSQAKKDKNDKKEIPPDEFWVATFKKTSDVVPVTLRVYWSWSGDGQWQVPDRPRLTFARYPLIYKLYVVQSIANENVEIDNSPVHDLIKELTAVTRASIFAPAAKAP